MYTYTFGTALHSGITKETEKEHVYVYVHVYDS